MLPILRVAYFTTKNQQEYQNFSDDNFMRAEKLSAMRGRILDRNGAVLAVSEHRGDVVIDTRQLPNFVQLKQDNAKIANEPTHAWVFVSLHLFTKEVGP